MRTSTSHKPALVRYFPLVIKWIDRAWAVYRFIDRMMALAEVVM
ncbi:hypothetical protein NCHU2750_33130 [Neorhizobium sp. NCHU2750]|nr:hypothetical protein NCHU2750_33130 [Neorhizobium sp. NCHU2750]